MVLVARNCAHFFGDSGSYEFAHYKTLYPRHAGRFQKKNWPDNQRQTCKFILILFLTVSSTHAVLKFLSLPNFCQKRKIYCRSREIRQNFRFLERLVPIVGRSRVSNPWWMSDRPSGLVGGQIENIVWGQIKNLVGGQIKNLVWGKIKTLLGDKEKTFFGGKSKNLFGHK